MSGTVSADLLLRVAQATPEQQAAIERFLAEGKEMGTAEYAEHAEGGGEKGDQTERQGWQAGNRARFLFRRAGSHWRVVFDGGPEFHVEDTLGTRYLDYLLHHPNESISAFDLEVAIRPEKAAARSRSSIQKGSDPEAARAYLRELSRLRVERDEAAEAGSLAEAERLDGEIEALESALRGDCRAGDSGERARSNVNKAVAVVRRRLARGEKPERAFGEYIQRFVNVGYQCMYAQAEGERWG